MQDIRYSLSTLERILAERGQDGAAKAGSTSAQCFSNVVIVDSDGRENDTFGFSSTAAFTTCANNYEGNNLLW